MTRFIQVAAAIVTGLAVIVLVGIFVSALLPADPPGAPIILPSPTPYPSNWTYQP